MACLAHPSLVKLGLVLARLFHFNSLVFCIRLFTETPPPSGNILSITRKKLQVKIEGGQRTYFFFIKNSDFTRTFDVIPKYSSIN